MTRRHFFHSTSFRSLVIYDEFWTRYSKLVPQDRLARPEKLVTKLNELDQRLARIGNHLSACWQHLDHLQQTRQRLDAFSQRSGIEEDVPIASYLDAPGFKHPDPTFLDLDLDADGFVVIGLEHAADDPASPSHILVNDIGEVELAATFQSLRNLVSARIEHEREIEDRYEKMRERALIARRVAQHLHDQFMEDATIEDLEEGSAATTQAQSTEPINRKGERGKPLSGTGDELNSETKREDDPEYRILVEKYKKKRRENKLLKLRDGRPSRQELKSIIDENRFESSGRVNSSAVARHLGIYRTTAKRWINEEGLADYAGL